VPLKTCAEAIVQSLLAHGVDTIFGLPGAQTYALFDAIGRTDIKLVCSRHEQGAAYMAFGYAKSTGRTGVYCVVPGPGVLNTMAALCTAHNAPVLCLTGQVPSGYIGGGHGMLHELRDQLDTLRGVTKWAGRINHPSEALPVMAEAFKQLGSGRVQPVAVEIPGDVLAQRSDIPADYTDPPYPLMTPDPDCISSAAALVREARSPMIMAGSGAVDAGPEVLELARLIQAPVVSFRGGRGIVSDDSPFGFNCAAGYKLYPACDLMIGIGTRLELPAFRWQEGVADQLMIRIDIDPTQNVRLRGNVSIVADARLALRALLDELAKNWRPPPPREQEFLSVKASSWQEIQRIQPQMGFLNVMRKVLPHESFLVEEISQVGFASWYGFPVYEPRKLVTCGYQGNLGHGFQTALGVKVAHPDTPVVSITGDGGFMFGVQELATAVQYNIGVIVLLFNNQAFGNVRRDQINLYGGRIVGSELRNPDFVKLAESFGAAACRANSCAELESLLEQALADSADGPVLIEVPCERGSEASAFEFMMPANYGK